jgi:hypothetical protein
MDLLSLYSSLVDGLARPDSIGVEWRFHCDAKENSLWKVL